MNNQLHKAALLMLACIAMATSVYAQDNTGHSNNFIGLTGGYSSLSGNVTHTDYADNRAGFAKQGTNFGITGTYFVRKRWGVTALASYQKYGTHGLQNLADGFKEDFDIDSSTIYTRGSNYALNFLVGPVYSIPIGKKLNIDLRVMGGLVNAHLAGYEVDIEDNASSTFSQKEAKANTIGLQAGAAARYAINMHFGVMLNIDYYYAKPDFTIDNVNRANNAGRLVTAYNEPFTSINANLSFVYLLYH